MDLKNLQPKVRHLEEMKEVLFDQEWAKTAPNLELYYMYRDLSESEADKKEIIDQGLRYDITVMPYLMLGREFNKTAGHDHPLVSGKEISYPEIYQVLAGQVVFLFQDSQEDQIKDVYIVEAKEKDQIIIPPNYEHLIINTSGKEIKTANWVCRQFPANIYKPFRNKHGFSYFALKGESEEINWVKNENYTSIPSLKKIPADRWLDKFKIPVGEEMYQLVKDLSKLDFLKNPQKYSWS